MAPTRGSAEVACGNLEVVQFWRLPDGFYSLSPDARWRAVQDVTCKAEKQPGRRRPCRMSALDEAMAVAFFLVTLGLPWFSFFVTLYFLVTWSAYLKWCVLVLAALAFHPMPRDSLGTRWGPLSLALMRYFSFEILLDRSDPHLAALGRPAVDSAEYQEETHLPSVCLACPHGVFNYGAICWCTASRWVVGWNQFTGGATIVNHVPGLRYMNLLIWMVDADRKSIKRLLQSRSPKHLSGEAARRGGMLGMVPDGILGAFRSTPGVEELHIGKKRGLMRICAEEGANIYAGWFFGTTDMLTTLKDPWGVMEAISRRTKAGMLGYVGRWFLPVPYRVAVTACLNHVKAKRTAAPTEAEVEQLHQEVYGGLVKVYEAQKDYAGYPDRTLVIR